MNANGEGKRHLALERAVRTISPAKRGCQKAQPSCYMQLIAQVSAMRQQRCGCGNTDFLSFISVRAGSSRKWVAASSHLQMLVMIARNYNLVGARLQCLRKRHKEGGGCHYHTSAPSWLGGIDVRDG